MICGSMQAEGRGIVLARVWRAANAWDRARGLLGRPQLRADEGLLIDRCSSVHTFGMAYPIDLAFLDAAGRVLRIVPNVKPLRVALRVGASATLEMAAGAAAALALRPGDKLQWSS